jgi:hypothetical protein
VRPQLIFLPTVALVVGAAVSPLTFGTGASAQEPVSPAPQQFMLRLGDTMQVQGAPLRCQVTSRTGRPTVECRRTGGLKGTYGMFFDSRKAVVARFHSATSAQTVFQARHHGDWTACMTSAQARAAATATTRAAQEHCR